MALTRGILTSVLVGQVRTEVQDTGSAPRWSDAQILLYINDAFHDLAQAGCFRRTDVLVPAMGQAVFQPLLEAVKIYGVWYCGERLQARSTQEAERLYGDDWTTQTGTPILYIPGDTLRIVPLPGNGGSSPTFGTAPITEADGKGPSGTGYWSALNGSTVQHWLPGDGTVTGDLTAGTIWVDYSYIPGDVSSTMLVPSRWKLAVRDFAVAMCLEKSDDPGEQRLRDRALARYISVKEAASVGQQWSAEHVPMPALNQDGWERAGYNYHGLNG